MLVSSTPISIFLLLWFHYEICLYILKHPSVICISGHGACLKKRTRRLGTLFNYRLGQFWVSSWTQWSQEIFSNLSDYMILILYCHFLQGLISMLLLSSHPCQELMTLTMMSIFYHDSNPFHIKIFNKLFISEIQVFQILFWNCPISHLQNQERGNFKLQSTSANTLVSCLPLRWPGCVLATGAFYLSSLSQNNAKMFIWTCLKQWTFLRTEFQECFDKLIMQENDKKCHKKIFQLRNYRSCCMSHFFFFFFLID